jgi:hypothetical protein
MIYNLLANTQSLEEFDIMCHDLPAGIAFAMAAGMSQNSSIKTSMHFDLSGGPALDLLLSGFAASSVQSLSLHHGESTENL